MDSRQRARAALNHQQPDRVPVSLGSNIVDSLTKYAKDQYETYLGLELTPHCLSHKSMGIVDTPEKIAQRLETDFRPVRLKKPTNYREIVYEDDSFLDDYGCLMKPKGYYYECVKRPLEGSISKSDIAKSCWPDPYAPGRADGLREEVKNLYENSQYSLVADICSGGVFEQAMFLRGWEDFLVDLYTEPELAEALMDRLTETAIGFWDVFLSAVGDYVDVVCQGDDVGMQDRAIIPLDVYRKYVQKYQKRINDFIKSKTKAKLFLHTCGAVYELLPGIIEAGFEILNPVQTTAANMDPVRLKREFGQYISFWGGIDTQRLLPFGTPAEVTAEVRRMIEILGQDGGYVLASVHNIQALVPPANIDALFKAALNNGHE